MLLFLSDFDPEGESIAESFSRSLRDDFGIDSVTGVKVALTAAQVEELSLPPVMTAKAGSSRRKGFVERHGENVFELEAVPPARLQQYLRASIESLIDMDLFRAERDAERSDARQLAVTRNRVRQALVGEIGP